VGEGLRILPLFVVTSTRIPEVGGVLIVRTDVAIEVRSALERSQQRRRSAQRRSDAASAVGRRCCGAGQRSAAHGGAGAAVE
jgi:hypothetical protein